MMTCQFLYDLRTVTGFISGSDLHELFQKLVGDPSPSGRVEIDLGKAEELCPELGQLMAQSINELMLGIAKYAGISASSPPSSDEPLAKLFRLEASSLLLTYWLRATVRAAEGE